MANRTAKTTPAKAAARGVDDRRADGAFSVSFGDVGKVASC